MVKQYDRKFGQLKDSVDHRDFRFTSRATTSTPNIVDNRHYCPPVMDQGVIGSCVGCGGSRAGVFRNNVLNYPWKYTPSALDIYAKARLLANTPLTVDSGAMIRDLFKAWNSQGICPEDSNPAWSWPYSDKDGRWQQMAPEPCQKAAAGHKAVKYMRLDPDPELIRKALSEKIPVIIGIPVFESFMSAKTSQSGIIPNPGWFDGLLGGHCMFLHSYGLYKDKNWVMGQNSWGEGWGIFGHFHINMKYLCNEKYQCDLWALDLTT